MSHADHGTIRADGDLAYERPWIPFGPGPTQILHPDTAAAMLGLWCERDPARFGALLAEVLTGAKLTRAHRPRGGRGAQDG